MHFNKIINKRIYKIVKIGIILIINKKNNKLINMQMIKIINV